MDSAGYRPQRLNLVAAGAMDHHVADLSATIAADMTLAQVQQQLAKHQQWLPIDGDPAQQIGALIAQNSTGPLRLEFGAWRDLLLGCQFTNGHGYLISAGGRTVKNVAGYDLTKLMVGQHTALGSIVTITTRTYRRPVGAILATFAPALDRVNALLPAVLRPQWMLLTRESLLCGYIGDEQTLQFCETTLRGAKPLSIARRSLDEDIADRVQRWAMPQEPGVAVRVSVPPARVSGFVAATKLVTWSADPVFGIVVGRVADDAAVNAVRRTACEMKGNLLIPPLVPNDTDPKARLITRLVSAFSPDV